MSKAIEALDALYQRSLEGDISATDRHLVEVAMNKIIEKCDDFLVVDGVQINQETRSKFRRLRELACEESRSAQLDQDVLCHWGVIRDLVSEFDKRF